MSVIIVLIITSIFGNSFWDTTLVMFFFTISVRTQCSQIGSWKLRHVVLCSSMIGSTYQILGYVNVIIHGGVGKNGSTIAGTSVIFPLFPLLMVVVPFCMIYSRAETAVYDEHITLFMLCFGAVGAKATNRLVIAHMSKSELRLWDWIYIGPLLLMLNQYYNTMLDELLLLRLVTVCLIAQIGCFHSSPAGRPADYESSHSI
ncbi:unnamed protein product [Haemonchus placei]|uniref:Na_H_Exchanger domain-containing protein n=1 Tax=Haemonchus placei TaxID=6290 RepID=A0A0N4XB13_HAEPC|nr:unnamed protein product [Haemonchus placei]